MRLRRQRRLTEEPLLALHAVVNETALHIPACDGAQLARIVECAGLPNVTLQVIPQDTDVHDGLYSNFCVVSFPSTHERDLAYVEYGFGSLQIEKEPEVRAARLMFEHLTDLALDEADSIKLVERVMQQT